MTDLITVEEGSVGGEMPTKTFRLKHTLSDHPLFKLDRSGADLHPALLRTAATIPLTRDARFDEVSFRLRLQRYVAGFALEAPPETRPQLGA